MGDLSLGLEYVENSSSNTYFNIMDIEGTSTDTKIGVAFVDVSGGGNSNNPSSGFLSKSGSPYNSTAFGFSVSPNLIGVTRTSENMGVIKLWGK